MVDRKRLTESKVQRKKKTIWGKTIWENPILEKPILETPILEKPIWDQPLLEQPNLEKPNLDHESTMYHWLGHGRLTIHDDKLPFSLHIVASSSWTMARTWTP